MFNFFQEESAASGMSNLLSIRNLVALLFCIVFFVLLYYYNESLDTLVTVERDKDKCQQNLDTLSAQLQVVYEHKSRLEKSLQVEKENAVKSKREQDRLLSGLQKKSDGCKKQFESLRTEYETLQQRFMQLKTEKQNLRSDSDRRLQNLKSEMETDKKNLKSTMEDLRSARDENNALNSRIQLLKKQSLEKYSAQNLSKMTFLETFQESRHQIEEKLHGTSILENCEKILHDVVYSSANNEKKVMNYSLENGGESHINVDLNMSKQTDVVNSQLAQPIPAATLNENKHQHLSESANVVLTGGDKDKNGTNNNRYSNALLSSDVNAGMKNNNEMKNSNLPKRNLPSVVDGDIRENEQDQVLEAPIINDKSKRVAKVDENRAAEDIQREKQYDSENAIQNANDDDFNEHQAFTNRPRRGKDANLNRNFRNDAFREGIYAQ